MDTQLRYELRQLMLAQKCNWYEILIALTTEMEQTAFARLNDNYSTDVDSKVSSLVNSLVEAQTVTYSLTSSGYLNNRALESSPCGVCGHPTCGDIEHRESFWQRYNAQEHIDAVAAERPTWYTGRVEDY